MKTKRNGRACNLGWSWAALSTTAEVATAAAALTTLGQSSLSIMVNQCFAAFDKKKIVSPQHKRKRCHVQLSKQ